MNPDKRKRLLNIIMVALIAVIVLSTVMAVGHARGWFGSSGLKVTGKMQDSSGKDFKKAEISDGSADKKDDSTKPSNTKNRKSDDSAEGSSLTAEETDRGSTASAGAGEGALTDDGSADAGDTQGEGSGSSTGSGSGSGSSQTSKKVTCTVLIRCDDILNYMDDLKEGKEAYVPSDGVILSPVTVTVKKGKSAYDATRKACKDAGIQMEAAYTPVYGSYYIEGINQLYEFDCGKKSGWVYTINGVSPSYGCSDYILNNGDTIEWSYTCTGR